MFFMRRSRRDGNTAFAWLLALALVGAQALGLVHALQHANVPGPATSSAASAAGDDVSAVTARVDDAYGHASSSAACVIWSGLLGGDAAAFDAPVHAVVDVAARDLSFGDDAIAPRDAAHTYDARGPPAA